MIRGEHTLMLIAKADGSKIYGIKQGADDYLSKHFNINELKARVEAIVRLFTDSDQKSIDQFKEMIIEGTRIDKENRAVKIDNDIELTDKEFDLLYLLAFKNGEFLQKI